jgi:hypothetical protein
MAATSDRDTALADKLARIGNVVEQRDAIAAALSDAYEAGAVDTSRMGLASRPPTVEPWDLHAAAVLTGLTADAEDDEVDDDTVDAHVKLAAVYADAMVSERAKRSQKGRMG